MIIRVTMQKGFYYFHMLVNDIVRKKKIITVCN